MVDPASAREPSSFELASTLGLFGLVSGLLLVGAYELTLPTIQKNDRQALERAVLEVVPHARTMKKFVPGPGGVKPTPLDDDTPGVYATYDEEGRLAGYALVGEGPGFQDVIRLIYGVDLERRWITGMEVLDSRETPGLGSKIADDSKFKKNFERLLVEPKVIAVKKTTKGASENQVDIITGATISSKAVVSIINQTNQRWLELLPAPRGQASNAKGVEP